MNLAEIKAATQAGRQVYGTMVTSPSPHLPVHLSKAGIDCVFIDTEHIVLDREKLSWMCRTYRALNLAPLVRIAHADPHAARLALDSGAAGVVAAYVETVDEVQALRGAVKYRPLKGKKLEAVLSGTKRLSGGMSKYVKQYSRGALLLVNIESVPAVENLDRILAVPDLDGILVGPHDLSCSLEIPEQYTHPRFKEALRNIATQALKHGVIAGMLFMGCGPSALAAEWMRLGYRLLIQHSDYYYAARGIAEDIQAIQALLEQRPERKQPHAKAYLRSAGA